jgi:hypothetical protein
MLRHPRDYHHYRQHRQPRQRDGADARALVAATDALNRATGDFAARRMDRGVARALTGRSVDALT